MSSTLKLSQGLSIRLKGGAEKVFFKSATPATYALKPSDFHGLTPKLLLREGDILKVGTPVFCDKYNPEVLFVSPVSGTLQEIKRGDRRKILEIIIAPNSEEGQVEQHDVLDVFESSREQVVSLMLKAGAWPFLVQRPYGIIANPHIKPSAIFISGFNTAPLAPDCDFLVNGESLVFQKGIDVLSVLSGGNVHLSLCADYPANATFEKAKNIHIHRIKGVHPAGNVGVQIHHISPIGKGDVVWTISPQHVIALGRLFSVGVYDVSKVVALVGSEVKKPRYYRTIAGASLSVLSEHLQHQNPSSMRIISGDVLTGTNVGSSGHLGFYDDQVTVIPEGNYQELLGWIMPRLAKFSVSKTYFSWLFPNKRYALDTNLNGGERAFVFTGQYEKVLPMSVFPVYLLKAILAKDIEKMEQLGIYDVIEEDLALCEFVCTSKVPVQKILRDGINLMIKEM
ncbi:MAG: Na(+)-translocating NADH-quinone reductase subunit A [Bacteroidales bacterium]